MMKCDNCNNQIAVKIPATTKQFHLCTQCISYPASISRELVADISRELSYDTFLYLLSQISLNNQLSSELSIADKTIDDLKLSQKYDLVSSLKHDRDTLLSENEKLKFDMSAVTKDNNNLKAQIKSSEAIISSIKKSESAILEKLEEAADSTSSIAKKHSFLLQDIAGTQEKIAQKIENFHTEKQDTAVESTKSIDTADDEKTEEISPEQLKKL